MPGGNDDIYSVVRLHLPLDEDPGAFAVVESYKVYSTLDGRQVNK